MAAGGEGDPAWDANVPGPVWGDGFDFTAWVEVLRGMAERHVRQCRLPADMKDEIAQQVAADLWRRMVDEQEAVTEGEAEEAVAKRAQAERRARRAEARVVAQAGAAADPVRPCMALCPTLSALAEFHPHPRSFDRRLLAAARSIAVRPKTLSGDHLRIFFLAWMECASLEDIRRTLELPETRTNALRSSLRRISRKLERNLIDLLAPHVSRLHATNLRAARQAGSWSGGPSVRETAISVFEGLGVVLGSRR